MKVAEEIEVITFFLFILEMKSFTIEDLISCGKEMRDRKQRYYDLTNKKGDCYYFFRNKYLSDMGAKKSIKYFLGKSECPICLEKVYNVQSSWITMCGHLFHKKCLHDWEFKTRCRSSCPVCRGSMGALEFLDGIKYCAYPNENPLDLLEETDNIIHKFCHECGEVLGADPGCGECLTYCLV